MTLFNGGNVVSSDSLAPNMVGRGPGGAVGVEIWKSHKRNIEQGTHGPAVRRGQHIGGRQKNVENFFFVFEIQDHHAVELTERSSNSPSDSSLSEHVAGDSTFSFYSRRPREPRRAAARGPWRGRW